MLGERIQIEDIERQKMYLTDKMKKPIFIIHPHSNLIYNVALAYLIKCLLDDKYNVTIFTNCPLSAAYFLEYQNIEIKNLPRVYPSLPKRPLLFLKKTLKPWIAAKLAFSKWKNPKIICVDPEGLLIANKLFPSSLRNFNYLSYELYFLDELKEKQAIKLHTNAMFLIKKGINSLIIPDKYRLKLFLKEHHQSKINRIFFIPVSPSKTSLPSFRNIVPFKPTLKKDNRSVIYSGSLYDWSGIRELIKLMPANWDKKFQLYIHAHGINSDHKVNLEQFISKHAKDFSIQILDFKLDYPDYLSFLMQFDIGLATYIPFTTDSPYDGKNFAEIGYSSSKFNTLMMLGIPTVTTVNNSFNDIKKQYDFGYIVKDFSEMGNALHYIDQHFEKNKKEAQSAYNNLLDPTENVKLFIKFLNASSG